MNYDETTSTRADRESTWAALAAVTTLPRWTTSMTAVAPLDGPDLRVGHRFRIKQPGFPPVVWRVTEVCDGESFTWVSSSPGVHTTAYHRLAGSPDGPTHISIGLRQSGVLAGILALLTARKTRHYLKLEAAGLKAAAEAGNHDADVPDRRPA